MSPPLLRTCARSWRAPRQHRQPRLTRPRLGLQPELLAAQLLQCRSTGFPPRAMRCRRLQSSRYSTLPTVRARQPTRLRSARRPSAGTTPSRLRHRPLSGSTPRCARSCTPRRPPPRRLWMRFCRKTLGRRRALPMPPPHTPPRNTFRRHSAPRPPAPFWPNCSSTSATPARRHANARHRPVDPRPARPQRVPALLALTPKTVAAAAMPAPRSPATSFSHAGRGRRDRGPPRAPDPPRDVPHARASLGEPQTSDWTRLCISCTGLILAPASSKSRAAARARRGTRHCTARRCRARPPARTSPG
mmetsp:Transcript_13004/g.42580  ORF Transcript_13004/g.42580 Transcript_13004/m.42580 type:complete len:303 (+) Transcript_13004:126-1034(+)